MLRRQSPSIDNPFTPFGRKDIMMKTIDISSAASARAFARPAMALVVSAVLGAAVLALPAHATGHDGKGPHGAQMQHASGQGHGQDPGKGKHHGQGHSYGQGHDEGHGHHGKHHGRHAQGGSQGMVLSEHMLDRVQASPEQKARIREILMVARKDLQARRDDGKALREQSMKLLTQPDIDPKAIEELRAQAMARHDAASKRLTQAVVEASQVLTPEQRQQLAQHMEQRRERMHRHHEERRAPQAPRS
jgi:Spy/CpxP family protein refolding chaperone